MDDRQKKLPELLSAQPVSPASRPASSRKKPTDADLEASKDKEMEELKKVGASDSSPCSSHLTIQFI